LRESGGIVGSRPVDFTFSLSPSSETFEAEVFECNSQNLPLKSPSMQELGGTIRVCVRPNANAQEKLVFMRSIYIDSFQLVQDDTDVTQGVVEAGGKDTSDDRAFLLCYAGDPVCAFKTQLRQDFF
jgi:hypothetical protein